MAISWTLNDGVLTISGTGAINDYYGSNTPPWYENKDSITSIIIENGVTSIGISAFKDCTALKSVMIPDSVTQIDNSAFYNCSKLTSVITPNSVTRIGNFAFYNCSALTNVTIPNGVTSINEHAFRFCTSLTNIIIPNSVTSIKDSAFANCTSLTSITIPNKVTSIGKWAFENCTSLTSMIISDSVTNIANNAFNGCSNLTDVYYTGNETDWNTITIDINNEPLTNATIHYNYNPIIASGYCGGEGDGTNLSWTLDDNGVLTISGAGAMENYHGGNLPPWENNKDIITSIEIQNGVTTIGNYTFDDTKISTITFPNSITTIGHAAFSGCNELINITIPNSVISITRAFSRCLALTNISVAEDNQYYASDTNGCLYNKNKTELIQYPIGNTRISFSIPNTVTSVEDEAFYGCAALTNITIPNNVTSINSRTFSDCTSLTSITIPDSVTNVEYAAFDGSTALTDVYYTGSETEWNAITIDTDNEPLLNATKHYSSSSTNSIYLVTKAELTSIANAIRAKAGTTSKYTWPNQMISAIEGLTTSSAIDWTGGGSINITSNKALSNTYFYDNSGNLISGNIPNISSTTVGLMPQDFSINGTYVSQINYKFSSGYYSQSHYIELAIEPGGYYSPLFSDETIVLYGSSATNTYFPNSIKIKSTAYWIDRRSTISGTYSNNTISKIDSGAFAYTSLTTASFPACKTIGSFAFAYCSSLTTASFPSCSNIGSSAFAYCSSLTIASFPNCSNLGSSAFAYCGELTTANFPNCSNIGSSAFTYCGKLTEVNFPNCTNIKSSAFYYCSKLTEINFPVCTDIGYYAFGQCSSLTTASFSACTSIADQAFIYCRKLTEINFPICSYIGWYTFRSCTSLTEANFPACTNIGNYAFSGCTSLTTANFPICSSIGTFAFAGCTSLTTAYFPKLLCVRTDTGFSGKTYLSNITILGQSTSAIQISAFQNCFRLMSLTILYSEGVAPLAAAAFISTPISTFTTYTSGVRGSIYVPASLVSAYKSATNWTYYSDRITSITS